MSCFQFAKTKSEKLPYQLRHPRCLQPGEPNGFSSRYKGMASLCKTISPSEIDNWKWWRRWLWHEAARELYLGNLPAGITGQQPELLEEVFFRPLQIYSQVVFFSICCICLVSYIIYLILLHWMIYSIFDPCAWSWIYCAIHINHLAVCIFCQLSYLINPLKVLDSTSLRSTSPGSCNSWTRQGQLSIELTWSSLALLKPVAKCGGHWGFQ